MFTKILNKEGQPTPVTVDDIDADLFGLYNFNFAKSIRGKRGYVYHRVQAITTSPRKNISLARAIAARIWGELAIVGMLVDHKDHNTANNCRDNLRLTTKSQNRVNNRLSIRNTLGYKGIFRVINRRTKQITGYGAQVQVSNGNGKSIVYHCGYHQTPEQAAAAYDKKAVELFGEYVTTNKSLGLLK